MKLFRYHLLNLRKQLILLILMIFIPVLAILLFTGYKQHQDALEDIETKANQLIRIFIEEQLNIVNQTRHFLSIIAHVPAVRNLDLAECNQFLKEVHQDNPQYSTIVAANSEGMIDCCAIPLKQPINVKDRAWFQRVTESHDLVIDHFIISRSSQKASLPFAFPILDSDKKLMVAVGAAYDLEYYQTIFNKIPLPRNSVILVTDKNGMVLHPSSSNDPCFGKYLSECRGVAIPESNKGRFIFTDFDGVERIYWFERLAVGQASNEITLLVGISKQEIYSSARRMLIINISLIAVIASLCLGMAWFFGKRIILDPVNLLVHKTRRIEKGDLNPPSKVTLLPGEFRILGQAFDDMLHNLSQRETERDGALQALQQEIIEHKETLATLREQEDHLKILFEQAADAIFVSRLDGLLVKVNQKACRSIGYTEDEMLALNVSDVDAKIPSAEAFAQFAQTLSAEHPITVESMHRRKDGSTFPVEITIALLQTHTGPQVLGIARDITERKQAEARIAHLAYHDALTQLPNRVLLTDRLQQAMAQARRDQRRLAVCFLDLDDFKVINDTWGHAEGDRVLVQVAQRLKGCIRAGDTVARLGGDEFVLLLGNLSNVEECEHALDRVRMALQTPQMIVGQPVSLNASLGVTLYPDDGVDPDALLRHVDQAMYAAKQGGGNRYQWFDTRFDRRAREYRAILQQVEKGLETGEFRLHYQPKVDMRQGVVMGLEALIRWQHPEEGLLPPARFMPAVETSGLAVTLDRWVLHEALRQMGVWVHQGLTLPVSVNLSARYLQQPGLMTGLNDLLANHPTVPTDWLELEILETAALEDLQVISALLTDCRQRGIRFALDDFGTGYSSLTYLRKLPVHVLKIDQSFVRDALTDAEARAIVEGVIGLSKAFRREVIAEGVETVAHGRLLLDLGCDLAQGYGIARPMPPDQLPAWIAGWTRPEAWVNAADSAISQRQTGKPVI
jgi:diguanylate cyclase (GGDEF)-like protein/PAS domain S-box-containing protein